MPVDNLRPEILEDAKEAAWSSIASLFQFAGASILTPLDRFGRLLPAYVMANSEDYSPDALQAFTDEFCKKKQPLNSMVIRAEDKLGLTSVDYACFSPHTQEAADFLRYAVCTAILRDETLPLPNLDRLAAVSFAADCFENLNRAKNIKDVVPRYLEESRSAIVHMLTVAPEYIERLQSTSMRGSVQDISRRFREAKQAWRALPIPDGDTISCAPQEAEYLVGLNHDKPVDRQIRDLLVNHLSAMETAPTSPSALTHH